MNRWHVYEYLKQTFMFSGRVLAKEAVLQKFGSQLPAEEIAEGILEFEMMASVVVPAVPVSGGVPWTSPKHWRGKKVDYRERVRV